MSGSVSIVRAEEKALAGNNESQDSQHILEAYQRVYGIGLVSVIVALVAYRGLQGALGSGS